MPFEPESLFVVNRNATVKKNRVNNFFLFLNSMRYQNLLLIDDDTDDQEIFLAALQTVAGSVVCTTAVNGYEALKKLEETELKPDLIFLDLNMPLMNGEQFLKEVKQREHLKGLPVIVLSTSSNPDTIQQTKKLGAQDFITKPNSFSELTGLLQAILV